MLSTSLLPPVAQRQRRYRRYRRYRFDPAPAHLRRHHGPVIDTLLNIAATLALLGLIWLFLSGCSTNPFRDPVFGRSYAPANSVADAPKLPPHIKRVALLPIAQTTPTFFQEQGRDALQPILISELTRTKRFEVVAVSPEDLQRCTGRAFWASDQVLPADFLDKIRRQTGCDAVLLADLTAYQPFQPIAIGWRLKLVDCQNANVFWSADELFNAGQPAVANAARRFYKENLKTMGPLSDSHAILKSPRAFGQYTACAVLDTLPSR